MDWNQLGVVEAVSGGTDPAADPGACRVTTPGGAALDVAAFVDADGRRHARARNTGAGRYEFVFDDATVTVDAPAPPPRNDVTARPGERHLRLERTGAPFLWVADTWWYAFSDRATDEGFADLLERRRQQGFTAVQLVAGLYPETTGFTPQAATGGRWSWTADYGHPDPRWWDAADERIAAIVTAGLTPAVVGAWSYYLLDLGDERMRRHWREVIARWSALPVVWCVAGEVGLPHYDELFADDIADRVEDLLTRWAAIGAEVRKLDPYGRPLTYHPCPAFEHHTSLDAIGDRAELDFVWMQTGHADRGSVLPSLRALARARAADPPVPVVNSEVCYEGIAAGSPATLQRMLFWSHLLSGAAGHTYGAQGMWAFAQGRPDDPGHVWGEVDWATAALLPGAEQTGLAGRLLAGRGSRWWEYEAMPDGVVPATDAEHPFLPYCAGTAGERVVYVPANSLRDPSIGISVELRRLSLRDLTPGRWTVDVVNPRTGETLVTHRARVDGTGEWELPATHFATALPTFEDWLLICRMEGDAS
ncbi:apiosidase-like domain-containing protein [Asanoa iriomotensis]|uniref:Apiosidase-like catalytic domain-containing protein n=1 Tax=Asanoa iriomotensis TaxID=234613 RepID=A0ABQ4BZ63_9ACTN|nr:DUF4038 domain-containing protein [Asanoa iriomotensis]GIF55820.1 hypothetical protein Air01nite_19150 [Asanoa iriomotensis]